MTSVGHPVGRWLVHDYSGHPFQAELSRSLARRGHEVLHVHCGSYQTGKGSLERGAGDPVGLRFETIDLGTSFDRYSVGSRLRQELRYGRLFNLAAAAYRPDVILSANEPLLSKIRTTLWCLRTRTPWVFWLQDIYSEAMARYAVNRMGRPGALIGAVFKAVERRLLHAASAVVLITEDFGPTLDRWRIPACRRHVIENWAPLAELSSRPKDNAWARQHDLGEARVVLYSGTLGLKHDPAPLLALAEDWGSVPDVRLVVVSEGKGADWLLEEQRRRGIGNLLVLPYQPYEMLSEVLATADVLVALLSSQAGAFSVPSKILSYLCAGRPILAALPEANLSARIIERAGAGIVVAPGDVEAFLAAGARLLGDVELRQRSGASARAYAEAHFDIESVTTRFESVLWHAARPLTRGTARAGGTAEAR